MTLVILEDLLQIMELQVVFKQFEGFSKIKIKSLKALYINALQFLNRKSGLWQYILLHLEGTCLYFSRTLHGNIYLKKSYFHASN